MKRWARRAVSRALGIRSPSLELKLEGQRMADRFARDIRAAGVTLNASNQRHPSPPEDSTMTDHEREEGRDSGTGRWVSDDYVAEHPDTTERATFRTNRAATAAAFVTECVELGLTAEQALALGHKYLDWPPTVAADVRPPTEG